jgi:DNA-binding response OmpR family regulator
MGGRVSWIAGRDKVGKEMEADTFAEQDQREAEGPRETTAPALLILLVEDEAVLRKVIARNLSAQGHTVLEAATAADALRELAAHELDLILLDINLPDLTGWEILRLLRGRSQFVPTVVVSAVRVSQARLEEFKPVAYLPKPFPLESLLRVVQDVSKQNRSMGSGLHRP